MEPPEFPTSWSLQDRRPILLTLELSFLEKQPVLICHLAIGISTVNGQWKEKIWIMSRTGEWPGELCVNLSILWESMCIFCMMLSRITHWMDMYALSVKVSRIIH